MFDESSSSATPPSQVEPAEYVALPPSTSSSLDIVSFCVDPSSVSDDYYGADGGGDGVGVRGSDAGVGNGMKRRGVVGTITFLADGRSAMVWFGWGDVIPSSDGTVPSSDSDKIKAVGSGVPPSMGPMVLSMPRTSYQHSTGGMRNASTLSATGDEPATTQLIGGESEEDMVVGHQMAARLAKKFDMPIYVCCSIHSAPAPSTTSGGGGAEDVRMMDGGDAPGFGGSLGQKAAAMAEREVGRILLERRQMNELKRG